MDLEIWRKMRTVSGQWTITGSPSYRPKENHKACMIHTSRNQRPWGWDGKREMIDMWEGVFHDSGLVLCITKEPDRKVPGAESMGRRARDVRADS